MSDRGDAVRSALTEDWQSTREIADAVPESRGCAPASHLVAVYKHLGRLAKLGEAEHRVAPSGRPQAEWRLRT